MKKIMKSFTGIVLLTAFTAIYAAGANLLGDTIEGRMNWNNLNFNGFNNPDIYDITPTPASVNDPGVEYSYPTAAVTYSADFDADTLTITYASQTSEPNQVTNINFDFTDLNYGGDIAGVQIISNDFRQTRGLNISFGADSIHVDIPWQNLKGNATDQLKLRVITQ